jgi:hypothetical protein
MSQAARVGWIAFWAVALVYEFINPENAYVMVPVSAGFLAYNAWHAWRGEDE